MACTECITYKFTNDEGVGSLVFVAEDPNGLTLEVQSITLLTFTDEEGEVTLFGEGLYPDWFDFEAVGDLISVGGLYRITLTLYFDFYEANAAGIGPGTYTGLVCFRRANGTFDNLCCEWEVCSEGIEAEEPVAPWDPTNVLFGGAWGSGNSPRIAGCTLGSGDTTITNIVLRDDLPDTNAVQPIAYDHPSQKIYFAFQTALPGQLWRCDLDGSNVELVATLTGSSSGNRVEQLAANVEGGKIFIGSRGQTFPNCWVYDIFTDTLDSLGTVGGVIEGVCVDELGNAYFSSVTDNTIYKYTAATGIFDSWAALGHDAFAIDWDPVNQQLFYRGRKSATIGLHVLDANGDFVRTVSDNSAFDSFRLDWINRSVIYINANTPNDVYKFDMDLESFGDAAKIGDVPGSTGTIFSLSVYEIPGS